MLCLASSASVFGEGTIPEQFMGYPVRGPVRPLANWFARHVIIKNPKIIFINPPVIMAVRIPRYGFPEIEVAAKPAAALTSIIPSKPRLTIPDRWWIVSPRVT